jgi:small neutral amino acid transporter SnatA (MarC family)
MSSMLAIVAVLAAVNPPRTRLGLPEDAGARVTRLAAAGIVLGGGALVLIAASADSLLSALEVSPETFRIAAGFVLVVVGAWMVFVPVPEEEPVPAGWAAAVWPTAYPRVVSPETIIVALTIGASDGIGSFLPGLGLGVAGLLGLGMVAPGRIGRRVLGASGRVLAVVVIAVGVWLAVAGIREV